MAANYRYAVRYARQGLNNETDSKSKKKKKRNLDLKPKLRAIRVGDEAAESVSGTRCSRRGIGSFPAPVLSTFPKNLRRARRRASLNQLSPSHSITPQPPPRSISLSPPLTQLLFPPPLTTHLARSLFPPSLNSSSPPPPPFLPFSTDPSLRCT